MGAIPRSPLSCMFTQWAALHTGTRGAWRACRLRWPLLTMWAFPGSIQPPAFQDHRNPLGPASQGRLRSHSFLEGPWQLQEKSLVCWCTWAQTSLLSTWLALTAPHTSPRLLGCDAPKKKMSASLPHSPSLTGGTATHLAARPGSFTEQQWCGATHLPPGPLQASSSRPQSWQAACLTLAAHTLLPPRSPEPSSTQV